MAQQFDLSGALGIMASMMGANLDKMLEKQTALLLQIDSVLQSDDFSALSAPNRAALSGVMAALALQSLISVAVVERINIIETRLAVKG